MKEFNSKKYGVLLADTLPAIIETDEQADRAAEVINRLMDKGEGNLSLEEPSLFRLLVHLVEVYEEKKYPMVGETLTPRSVLAFLMEQQGLKQKDLVDIFSSSGTVSEVLSGKRAISKSQAKKLAEKFHVSADLFI